MADGLRINLTQEEANAEVKVYEVPPTGKYLVNIVDIEEKKCGLESKNPGKPYWKTRFVIDEGKYAGQSIFTNIMLFSPATFLILPLVKSLFPHMIDGLVLDIPDASALIGKQVLLVGRKWNENTKRKNGSVREYAEFQVTGFLPAENAQKTTTEPDLLP